MVGKRTQYIREYSPKRSVIDRDQAQVYEHNVDYRMYRRRLEHWHSHDPFNWDITDSTGSDSSSDDMPGGAVTYKVPQNKLKHEKYNQKYKGMEIKQKHNIYLDGEDRGRTRERGHGKGKKVRDESTQSETKCDEEVQTPDWSKNRTRDVGVTVTDSLINKSTSPKSMKIALPISVSSSETSCTAEKVYRHTERYPKRKTYPKSGQKLVPPSGRKFTPCEDHHPASVETTGPFIPYGRGAQKRSVGHLSTHNVRASADIYPAALRAQKRREAEIQYRQENLKKSPDRIKRDFALFNEKVKRDTEHWDTEYRRMFPAHSYREYERALSARNIGGANYYVTV